MTSLFTTHRSNDTITWEAEPATRGTFTLLSTCIITLSLCVWSSVHLNLPGNDRDCLQKFLRRLAWITGALVAPEYLILTAWSQRQTAKKISKGVEEAFKSEKKGTQVDPESLPLCRRHPWTMTHSFWALMGGIAVDPGYSRPFIPDSKRSTLTPNGVLLLLKHEPQLLPDISEGEVKDKSKGGSVTKLVACVQATWFCMSCIARISQKWPVSMLELNTFAHALCTVIVYLLWWRKPLDIEQPLVVQQDCMKQLLAYMWMASKTSCIPKPTSSGNTKTTVGRDPEFEAIIDNASSARVAPGSGVASKLFDPAVHISSVGAPSVTRPLNARVTTTEDLPGTGFRVNGSSTRWKETTTEVHGSDMDAKVYESVHYKPAVFNLTPRDVRRWQLAREAMDKYHLKKPNTNLDLVTIKPVPEFMGLNFPDRKPITWAHLGFSLVAAGYGGLHALAWNAHFPTPRELKLWRISALVIASPAALCFLLILLGRATIFARFIFWFCYHKLAPNPNPKLTEKSPPKPPVVKEKSSSQRTARSKKITMSILRGLGFLVQALAPSAILFLYFPARVYLVYESFRTVFFLPPDAYRATMWTQYLPHIT